MRAFVDTSFFVAIAMKRDQWHERAVDAIRREMTLFTSSLVVNETISLLQARGYFSEALIFLRETRRNGQLAILYPDPAVQAKAWEGFACWGAYGANAIDCSSFALMNNYSIREVLTFDQHFAMAGFEVVG
jgi:predicted nucleic acid-binding protein